MSLLTPRWYPLRPHPEQRRLITSTARFCVVPAGRRSGKTERAKRKLIRVALGETRWADARYFLAAPTRDQAKAIFWQDLKSFLPPFTIKDIRDGDLMVRLITGTEIWVIGLDKPQRMEGRSWNGGIIDEVANVKAGAWPENIRPALSDRRGWTWLIGVPEGRNHYYEMWKRAISGEDPEWAGFTWKSADILPPEEVASARRDLDELTFQQEYEASFVNFEGRAYYPFSEAGNCARLSYDPARPIAFCFDFNVDPGVAVICQEQRLPSGQDGTGIIGEVYIPRNSNTPAVCRKLVEDWGGHRGRVVCYGDATGGARGSAKVQGSDWDLIRAELGPVFRDRLAFAVPSVNPSVRGRINAMNTRLKAGDGTVRMMVDPTKAPHVVKDLEGVRLLTGGAGEIDKKADPMLSHISDALGYLVAKEFPVAEPGRVGTGRTVGMY